MSTNVVSLTQPDANMYGVVPCPKCGSVYRWPSAADMKETPSSVICDDCGFIEPIAGGAPTQEGE